MSSKENPRPGELWETDQSRCAAEKRADGIWRSPRGVLCYTQNQSPRRLIGYTVAYVENLRTQAQAEIDDLLGAHAALSEAVARAEGAEEALSDVLTERNEARAERDVWEDRAGEVAWKLIEVQRAATVMAQSRPGQDAVTDACRPADIESHCGEKILAILGDVTSTSADYPPGPLSAPGLQSAAHTLQLLAGQHYADPHQVTDLDRAHRIVCERLVSLLDAEAGDRDE